jgi:hypothetical protein
MWQQRNHPVKSLSLPGSHKKILWCLLLEQKQRQQDDHVPWYYSTCVRCYLVFPVPVGILSEES